MIDEADKPMATFELERLKTLYREWKSGTETARRNAEQCFDYYDNRQLSPTQIATLRKRKQPEIFINRIAPAIDGILGVLEQGQADPRAFPRNEEDQDASEVATDSLRYCADKSRWQRVKLKGSKNYLLGGIGACIVEMDHDRDPKPRIIRFQEFIYDPHSQDEDFEDAYGMGIAKWMYIDAIKAWMPNAEVDLDSAASGSTVSFDDDDKPSQMWVDRKKKRLMIVELYINEGGWKQVIFYGGGILYQGDSPYMDEGGEGREPKPCNPIIAQSCKIKRDNDRYGPAEAMVPIQDEVNMRRSRGLNMVNSRQVRITDPNGPEMSLDTVREEAARPDGVLPYGVEAVQASDIASGQFQLLAESKAELERMGPNPAVLGQSAASSSGRAQLVRQQAGLTELTPSLGGIEDWELRVYRRMWGCIKQFWTDQKTVRVTDDVGAAKFLMVNEEVAEDVPAIVQGPDGQAMVGTQRVVREIKNRPVEMDMDIIIDTTADTANVQQEQFAELAKLAAAYPQDVTFDDLLDASSLPHKRELIEKRQARKQEAQQQQPPVDPRIEADVAVKSTQAAVNAAKADGMQLENKMNAIGAAHLIDAVPDIDNNLVAQTG